MAWPGWSPALSFPMTAGSSLPCGGGTKWSHIVFLHLIYRGEISKFAETFFRVSDSSSYHRKTNFHQFFGVNWKRRVLSQQKRAPKSSLDGFRNYLPAFFLASSSWMILRISSAFKEVVALTGSTAFPTEPKSSIFSRTLARMAS